MRTEVIMTNGNVHLLAVEYDDFVKAVKNNLENGIIFQEAETILGSKITLKISEISEVVESQI